MSEGMRVEARAVSRTFSGEKRAPVHAVHDASVVLEPGEFATLRGRSGSGKTTLLALLGGLDRPTSGTVLLDATDLAAANRSERTRLTRVTGFVFQGAAVIRRLPVWENVTCGLVPLGIPSGERLEMAREALRGVGLEELAWRRPERLSSGERQRVALARALVHRPRLLLADEPTSNLDPESAEIVCDVIAGLHDGGCTVLVASHDAALLARADRTLRMESGRLSDAAG